MSVNHYDYRHYYKSMARILDHEVRTGQRRPGMDRTRAAALAIEDCEAAGRVTPKEINEAVENVLRAFMENVETRMQARKEEYLREMRLRRGETIHDEWEEEEHPRDEIGRFTFKGAGGNGSKSSSGGEEKARNEVRHKPEPQPSSSGEFTLGSGRWLAATKTQTDVPLPYFLAGGGGNEEEYEPDPGEFVGPSSPEMIPGQPEFMGPVINPWRVLPRRNPEVHPSVEFNNPGNIRPIPPVVWEGQVGVHYLKDNPKNQIVVFDSSEKGMRAAALNLLSYQVKHNLNTIEKIINRWAPPHQNDTKKYIGNVSRALGIKPNIPIDLQDPETLKAFLKAMVPQEGKGEYSEELFEGAVKEAIEYYQTKGGVEKAPTGKNRG